jgi:adenylate kinase family enzyme
MQQQTLFILCGETFSGRSTLAKELANKYGAKERHDVPLAWMEEDAIKFERPTESENPIIYKDGVSLPDVD